MKQGNFLPYLFASLLVSSCASGGKSKSSSIIQRGPASKNLSLCMEFYKYNSFKYQYEYLQLKSSDSKAQQFKAFMNDYQHIFNENISIPKDLETSMMDFLKALTPQELLESPELLKLFILDSKDLYLSSKNLERSLSYLNEIKLTDKIKSLIPYTPADKRFNYYFNEFELKALPTNKKIKEVEVEVENLEDKVLYHVTKNKKFWESIKSRDDQSLNALIKYSGPGEGFYFTTDFPARQYGDYVVAFKVSKDSVYKRGDKPTEYFLTNGKGTKVVEYEVNRSKKEFKYLDYNLKELSENLHKDMHLMVKETETVVDHMKLLTEEFRALSIKQQEDLLKFTIININDEFPSNTLLFLKNLDLQPNQLTFILDQAQGLPDKIKKQMLTYFDVEHVLESVSKDFTKNILFSIQKSPGKTIPNYYKNQAYLYKQKLLDIDSFAKDPLNYAEFLDSTMKGMNIRERGEFLIDMLNNYPVFSKQIAKYLNKPFTISNDDYSRVLNWYVDNGKEFFLDEFLKSNPQAWSIPKLSQTIKKSEELMSLWEESKHLYPFSTPLSKSM